MLCYRDMTFCADTCANFKCERNAQNINHAHVEVVGLPVAYMSLKDSRLCIGYEKPLPVGQRRG
jgi:hypothetical protein